jgi:hypothetical protein
MLYDVRYIIYKYHYMCRLHFLDKYMKVGYNTFLLIQSTSEIINTYCCLIYLSEVFLMSIEVRSRLTEV